MSLVLALALLSNLAPNLSHVSGAKVEKEAYVIEMKAVGPCVMGASCKTEITLLAKGDFKANDLYPNRFKFDKAPEGIAWDKPKFTTEKADGGRLETKSMLFSPTFKPSKKGRYNISGLLNFSVCSSGTCLMESATLDLTIEAK